MKASQLIGALGLLALSACSPQTPPQKPAEAPASSAAEETNPPPLQDADPNGVAITLADCAGAAAFMAGLTPIKQAEPKTDRPDENFYWLLLALLDKEPGFEGDAGRLAAQTAMTAWEEKSEAAARTFIDSCKARYAPQ